MIKRLIFFSLLVFHGSSLYAGRLSSEYERKIKEEEELNLQQKKLEKLNKEIVDSSNKVYCNSDKERFFLDYYQAEYNKPSGILISMINEKAFICVRYDYSSCRGQGLGGGVIEITNSFPNGTIEIADAAIVSKWEYEYDSSNMILLIKYIGGNHPFFKELGVVERLDCYKNSKKNTINEMAKEIDIYEKAKGSPLELIK